MRLPTLSDNDGEAFRLSTETASDGHRPDFEGQSPLVRERDWDANGINAC